MMQKDRHLYFVTCDFPKCWRSGPISRHARVATSRAIGQGFAQIGQKHYCKPCLSVIKDRVQVLEGDK